MVININGIDIYYEVYGEGKPLILLHGNGETHKIFYKVTEKLKEDFKVYLIDSRCHGKSQDTKQLTYDLMAEDVIEFIKKLNIFKPILYGFSDGGIIGLMVAIKRQNLLYKLIISGANISPKGLNRALYLSTKIKYIFTRNKLSRLMLKEPNITKEELARIDIPVVVLAGDKDDIKRKHTEYIAENIKESKLKILDNETHGSYVMNTLKLYDVIKEYILK